MIQIPLFLMVQHQVVSISKAMALLVKAQKVKAISASLAQ